MTNVIATLSIVITTNWATVSITRPAPSTVLTHAMYSPDMLNQVGRRHTNTVATFVWKGTINEVVIESAQEHGNITQQRTIPDVPPSLIQLTR